VLPSWFETTGLSSLEAAAMRCNIVITDKGDTTEYFEHYAFYCDPASPESIYSAVNNAATSDFDERLYKKIYSQYTWLQTSERTLEAYKETLGQT
jgi:glycosyltransferase involved in cell wall biosynthesis